MNLGLPGNRRQFGSKSTLLYSCYRLFTHDSCWQHVSVPCWSHTHQESGETCPRGPRKGPHSSLRQALQRHLTASHRSHLPAVSKASRNQWSFSRHNYCWGLKLQSLGGVTSRARGTTVWTQHHFTSKNPCLTYKQNWESPGGPVDRTQRSMQRAQVQSLVGELRFPTSPTARLKDRIKSNQIKTN